MVYRLAAVMHLQWFDYKSIELACAGRHREEATETPHDQYRSTGYRYVLTII